MKAHLTKRYIENIVAPEKRLWITDDTQRGLTLLVTPNGIKSWYLIRKFRGKVDRNYMGRFTEVDLSEAKLKATAMQAQYDQGISPLETKRMAEKVPTLDEFFEIYYRDHCQIKNRRPEKTKAEYMRYLSPAFGDMQLTRIQRADIKMLLRQIGEDNGHRRTANIVHTIIRAMFNKAIAWEYSDSRNPAEHIERYPEKIRKRVLQANELPRFHEALKLEPCQSSRDAILMLLYTGARKMNVLSMHWKDIDMERALWVIPDTKNGEAYGIALTPQAMAILNRRRKRRSSVYVFPGKGRLGHLENLKKVWQRLLDRAGIDDLWIHDLRRTVGSYMANLGANQAQIQMQLGHKDPQSAKPYIQPDLDFVRPFTARVSNALSPEE